MWKAIDVVVAFDLASDDRTSIRTQTEISKALGVSQSIVRRSLARLEGRPQQGELRRFAASESRLQSIDCPTSSRIAAGA